MTTECEEKEEVDEKEEAACDLRRKYGNE